MLAEPSVFESIVYAGTWLPYPMKPFELVLSVRWVDLVQVRFMLLTVATRRGTVCSSSLRKRILQCGCRRLAIFSDCPDRT